MTSFVIPVEMVAYNGERRIFPMGPFEHSAEREFALTVNRRAIDECSSLDQLKPVAKNLLEGWSTMHTALQSMMLENIQLRQALAQRDNDLHAADELLGEASKVVDRLQRECNRQSGQARWSLWPW
jgi:hypothetical protein